MFNLFKKKLILGKPRLSPRMASSHGAVEPYWPQSSQSESPNHHHHGYHQDDDCLRRFSDDMRTNWVCRCLWGSFKIAHPPMVCKKSSAEDHSIEALTRAFATWCQHVSSNNPASTGGTTLVVAAAFVMLFLLNAARKFTDIKRPKAS